MNRNLRYIFLTIMLIGVLCISSGCDIFKKTNKGKADLNWYMGLTYEDENGTDQPYMIDCDGDVAAVVLETGYGAETAIVCGDEAFLNIKTITSNIDERFYWDKEEQLVMFTNASQIYTTKVGSSDITGEKNETVAYVISIVDNGQCYINMRFVAKFVDLDYTVTKKNGETPARVSLTYTNDEKTVMTVNDDIEMRTKGDYQNLIVTVVSEDSKVTVLEEGTNWTKVMTQDGYVGYVPTKKLDDKKTEQKNYKNDYAEYTHLLLGEKVSMAWNQVYNSDANSNLDDLTEKAQGINVVSPTWFSLEDKRGNLSSLADLSYVENAHSKGMQVWALVNDFSDKKLTKKVLTSTETRQRLVNNIMHFADSYDLDGINIDFEYITEEIIDSYLQFLRELSIECRKQQVVLSIDNYVPSDWSEFYNRKHQALLADYIVIMNYDEHTGDSEVAGSVASMAFAEKSIQDTLEQVGDASRVIQGIPFYTRIWEETPASYGEGEGKYIQDSVNGDYYLVSRAVGMDTAKEEYEAAGAKPSFDETTGQNYVTYNKGETTCLVWLEDETSVKTRLELMNQYELGGAAYWALGQESDNIWQTIKKYFK